MGFFGRLFGTDPAARLAKARRFYEDKRYVDARWELEELDVDGATELRSLVMAALARVNMDEARARFTAGDHVGANEHLALAKEFGAADSDIKDARRMGREVREREEAEKAEAERRQAELEHPDPEDAVWALPPDDPRLRYALLVETWPEPLQDRLLALGADFAEAVLMIEDGHHKKAFEALAAHVSKDPVVRYERARAAMGANMLPAASSELRHFGEGVGHQRIGTTHTAVLLAQVLAQIGRMEEALQVVETSDDPDPAIQVMRASLLEGLDRLEEAERVLLRVLRKISTDLGLYKLLARIRIKRGDRMGAMQALENALVKLCSSPGKCGNQPFDVEAGRTLARLYLEDRIEPARTEELLDEISKAVMEPTWDDHYLLALRARNQGDGLLASMVEGLRKGLEPGDPRVFLLEAFKE